MKKKVLILESNEQFAQELSAQFVKDGYEICGVTDSGAEGFELLKKYAPALVVMNMTLRGADGFSVLQEAAKESTINTVFTLSFAASCKGERENGVYRARQLYRR